MTEKRPLNRDVSAEAENQAATDGAVVRNAAIFALFTLLSRVVALVRDLVISHYFGASRVTDAYVTAFTIPNVLRRLVAEGGVTVAVIPIYTSVKQHEGPDAARRFFAASLGLSIVGVGLMTLLGIWGSPALVFAFASGLADEPEVFALAVELTRWIFPYVYCIGLVGLAMGALNAHGHFAAPAAAPALLNLSIVVCTLALQDRFAEPIFAVAVGVLVGGAIQLGLQLPFLARYGLLVWPSFRWRTEPVRRLGRALLPALFGLGVYQINIVVLRQLGSWLPAGQLTYYYNADRLAEFALGVFGIAIASAALPAMSERAARGDITGLLTTWRDSLTLTSFVIVPSAAGLAVIAYPLVALLYRHGQFSLADVERTAHATIAFAPWLVTTAFVRTTVQAFYAVEDMKTPVKVATIVVTANLAFGVLLLPLEVVGLCLSLSLSSALQLTILLVFLQRRFGQIGLSAWLKRFAQHAGLSAMAVVPPAVICRYGSFEVGFSVTNAALLFSAIAAAVLVYGVLAFALGLEEARSVVERLRTRVNRRRPPPSSVGPA